MNENTEIRTAAWNRLWAGNWFGRILLGTILLNLVVQLVFRLLTRLLGGGALAGNTAKGDILEKISSGDFAMDSIGGFLLFAALGSFISLIASGISQYGGAVILVRAADDNSEGWLKSAFGGFKIPLGLAALSFRLLLVFLFWGILAGIPCAIGAAFMFQTLPDLTRPDMLTMTAVKATALISVFAAVLCIPFYRYRYAFRIKADNPEWSAGQCMKKCRAMTAGTKWRIFKHDCSYWRILLAPVALCVVLAVFILSDVASLFKQAQEQNSMAPSVMTGMFFLAIHLLILAVSIVAAAYLSLGQTLLYRKILGEKPETDPAQQG